MSFPTAQMKVYMLVNDFCFTFFSINFIFLIWIFLLDNFN